MSKWRYSHLSLMEDKTLREGWPLELIIDKFERNERGETRIASSRKYLLFADQMPHESGAWPDCSPLLCGHPARK